MLAPPRFLQFSLYAAFVHSRKSPEVAFVRLADWLQNAIQEAGLDRKQPKLGETFELRNHGLDGLSLISKKQFQEGETVLILPLSHLVSQYNYSMPGTDGLPPRAKAALFLARQKRLGKKSKIWPYIDLLPEDHPHLPSHWDDIFIDTFFRGSSFPLYVKQKEQVLQHLHQQMHRDQHISWADFKWAWDNVKSRSYGVTATGGESVSDHVLLYPLIDIFQHSDFPSLSLIATASQNQIRATASRKIDVGDDLTLQYWPYPGNAWRTMQQWGFFTNHTELTVAIHVSREEALQIQRKVLGSGVGQKIAIVLNIQQNVKDKSAKQFIGYIRQLAAGGFSQETKDDMLRACMDATADISTTEAVALRIGQLIIKIVLAKYGQAKHGQHAYDPHLHYGVKLYLGEMSVLRWWLKALRRAIKSSQTTIEL